MDNTILFILLIFLIFIMLLDKKTILSEKKAINIIYKKFQKEGRISFSLGRYGRNKFEFNDKIVTFQNDDSTNTYYINEMKNIKLLFNTTDYAFNWCLRIKFIYQGNECIQKIPVTTKPHIYLEACHFLKLYAIKSGLIIIKDIAEGQYQKDKIFLDSEIGMKLNNLYKD